MANRFVLECECLYFLGDQRGTQEACGRTLAKLVEATTNIPDRPGLHSSLGLAYAFLGRSEDAIREGELAVALLPVEKDAVYGPHCVEYLAQIYSLVGEHEAAIDQIEYLLSIPSNLTLANLRAHPYWDPLRDHPRFQALLEEYETGE